MKVKDQMKRRNNHKLKRAKVLKQIQAFFEKPYETPPLEYYYRAEVTIMDDVHRPAEDLEK